MKTHQSALILVSSLIGHSAMGQLIWNLDDHEEINRFGVSGRLGFNASASFSNLGGFAAQTDPGPGTLPPGLAFPLDRNYDDGYVRLDSVGKDPATADGRTSNWSHLNASQDRLNSTPASQDIAFHSSRVDETHAIDDVGQDTSPGFEVSYGRLIGRRGRFSWGYEVALGYANFSFEDSSALHSDVEVMEDIFAYAAGPLPPPGTPGVENRSGTPGAFLIDDAPYETNFETLDGGAVTVGYRKLETSLYSLRMGPFVEMLLFHRASAAFGVGMSVVMIDSEFSYEESTTIASMGPALVDTVSNTQTFKGTGSDSSMSVGYYLSGRFSYALNRRWDLFGAVDLQAMGTQSQTLDGRKAEVDLGTTVFLSLGVGYFF